MSPLTTAQEKLRALFDGFAASRLLWQDFASKEAWLDAEIKSVMALATKHETDDPLVAFDLFARALGLLVLDGQLGGG